MREISEHDKREKKEDKVRRVEKIRAHRGKLPPRERSFVVWQFSFNENDDEDYKAAAKRRGS